MDAIVEKVQSLAKNADDKSRKDILDRLRDLSISLETPQDAMQRISYLHLQPILVRIGCDLKLFNILTDNKDPLTLDQLSAKTSAAPLLLGNNDTIAPIIFELPEFLAEIKYQNFTNPLHTPLQKAWKTNLPAFLWIPSRPENHAHFNRFMEAQHRDMRQWLDVYPIEEKIQNLEPEQVLFVDVGGGIGHQSVALRKRLPDIKNRIIVQDMEVVIAHAIVHEGVEPTVYDFYQPQPIKGARIYYFRNIMHDYPDDKAVAILKNIIAALGPDSVILIDDMVLPDSKVHWQATQIDITMMSALASRERTVEAWSELMQKAGLKINRIYTYTESLQDSILEVVPV
ncbi:O-methyl transferase B [Talaromyces proteolyticus]|uniref:O-methyl transferase B n=1 Tax=Talaromyces proteolyticus TaxID=1131652 RepID=A0AAD4KDE8_9EURO|nr:O-methyl transferase B [Talaromyces proteolyticus]KAH8689511.1 O-methyl transferase B [Talaromyces proteolyticus]